MQRLPHALLERGAAYVQRQVMADVGVFDQPDHLRHELLEAGIAADQFRAREAIDALLRPLVDTPSATRERARS